MDCSMLGFPVHHQLPELTQTVHRVSDAIMRIHLKNPHNYLLVCWEAFAQLVVWSKRFASWDKSYLRSCTVL